MCAGVLSFCFARRFALYNSYSLLLFLLLLLSYSCRDVCFPDIGVVFFRTLISITKQFNQKQILLAVEVLFSSLKEGITWKICMLCFVKINSVPFNLLCVWIFSSWERMIYVARHPQATVTHYSSNSTGFLSLLVFFTNTVVLLSNPNLNPTFLPSI